MSVTCDLRGGLGNQLFQIFATIAHAKRMGESYCFLNVRTLGGEDSTQRSTYWGSLLHRLQPKLVSTAPPVFWVFVEQGFAYTQIPPAPGLRLEGYFQSSKYFEAEFADISAELGLKELRHAVAACVGATDQGAEEWARSVSMHFRIGDYKPIQDVHPLATYAYYQRALEHVLERAPDTRRVIYFCEDSDLQDVEVILQRLVHTFPGVFFCRVNGGEDWEQLLCMSLCGHHIMANSTFSWWGAYLNPSPSKVVCYPSVWFGETIENDTKDLCPPAWQRIESS